MCNYQADNNTKNKMLRLATKIKFEYRITILYFIVGIAWILFSDSFVEALALNYKVIAKISIAKGFFYVFITSLLLFFLVRKHLKRISTADSIIKQRNEELENQNKELKILKEAAEESSRLKTSFLQNISHEIRTPLNGIIGFSEIITRPNQEPEKLKLYSDMIKTSSHKLLEIITDVIEIAQLSTNQMEVHYSKIEIMELVDSLTEEFSSRAMEKGLSFEITNKIPKHFQIATDVEKFKRILYHLIDNAIKFTHRGRVEVYCQLIDNNIQFSVSDSGIGISAEMQSTIFEPFRQVELDIDRSYGGNGLGLSLIKAYTQLLNGALDLKSEVNIGSTFTIKIPISTEKLGQSREIIKPSQHTIKTILIVEDEYVNYQYLNELLSESGYDIIYANNGQDAVEICKNNSSVDFILMDIKMPIMDGYTAAQLIKSFNPNLPIVAQTAYAMDVEKNRFGGVFDGYLKKPIMQNDLFHAIEKFL